MRVPPEGTGDRYHPGLLLRVRRPGGGVEEVYLADGLTIGRSVANTVALADDPAAERAHARVAVGLDGVARLECVGTAASVLAGGLERRGLELLDGVRFRIGASEFECLAVRRDTASSREPVGPVCPECGATGFARVAEGPIGCPACGAWLLAVPAASGAGGVSLLPATYGEFLAASYVARGGQGVVLRGAHESSDRGPVAIKVLLPDADGGRCDDDRLGREATLLAGVCHPGVVRLLGDGRSGGFRYLILEWVDGPSLRTIIDEGRRGGRPTDFATATLWLSQVAAGLAAIHTAGVVHRDVKPSNILVGPDGAARIADLGISRRLDVEQTAFTSTGGGPGTFAYMAPEQLSDPVAADGRADLYALGVTFYELLAGRLPMGAWKPASAVNRSVPAWFDAVLGRLLEPRPEDRFADADAVIAALARALPAPPTAPRLRFDRSTPTQMPIPAPPSEANIAKGVRTGLGSLSSGSPREVEVTLSLEPDDGTKTPWMVTLSEDWMTLIDPGGGSYAIPANEAEAATTFPTFWLVKLFTFWMSWMYSSSLKFRVPGEAVKEYKFKAVGPEIRALRAYFDAVAERRGGAGVWSVFLMGIGHILGGIGIVVMVLLVQYFYPSPRSSYPGGPGRMPPPVIWAAFAGLYEASKGIGAFWRAGRIGWRVLRRARSESVADPERSTRPVAATRAPAAGSLAGPWNPWWLVAGGLILFGPLWVGLMAWLNWGRLGRDPRPWRPLAIAAAGFALYCLLGWAFPVTGTSYLVEFSVQALIVAAVVPNDLLPQYRLYAAHRAAGGGRGGWRLPIAAGLTSLVASVLVVYWADRPVDAYRRGVAAGQAGNFDQAADWFSEAIRRDPSMIDAYRARAQAYLSKRDLDRAWADCTQVLLLTRGDLDALVMRAAIALDRGDYAGTVKDCDQAILQDPLQAEAYRNRGIARIGLGGEGNANLAIEDFGAYIRLRPQDREGYWRRATIELDLSKIKPAILDLDRAIQIGPPDAAMHRERARAYLLDGQKDRALVDLGEAVRLDPADTAALRARVGLLVDAGSVAAALSDCDKIVVLAPNDPDGYCFRSWAHNRAGNGDKALADAEAAIRLAPDRAWPYYTRGLARTMRPDLPAAIDDLGRAIELDPQFAAAYELRSWCHAAAGDRARAEADDREARRLGASPAH